MMVYSYADARQKLAAILELALAEGQVKLRNRNGQVFVIRPERIAKTSPFNVRSVKLTITKSDILSAVRESQERF
jgi:hypothetical protein